MKTKTLSYIREKSSNILVAAFYGYFCYIHIASFINTGRISSLLIVILETVLITVILFRRRPKEVSFSPYDWTIAFMGTLMPLLIHPAPTLHESLFLYIIQLIGIFISMAGAIALNTSFGFISANRGIKTNGLYRFIRHPIYLGYFFAIGAYILQNITPLNIAIYILWGLFQTLRIVSEEDFLRHDITYTRYKQKTRWRLIPFIW